jgi:mRNA interferase RelE/StbE
VRYTVQVQSGALKALAHLPPTLRARAIAKIDALAVNPCPPGTRELAGGLKGICRIRVGDYRVAFTVDHEAERVIVWAVGHRRSFYDELARLDVNR